mgnify:FL=1
MLPLAALRSQDEFHRIVAAGDPVQRATPVRASVHRARGMVMVHDGATGARTAEQGAVEMILLGCAHGDDDALGGGITEFARQVERATESDLGARSGSSSTVTCWAGGGVLTAAARRLAARRHVPAFRRASRAIAGPAARGVHRARGFSPTARVRGTLMPLPSGARSSGRRPR